MWLLSQQQRLCFSVPIMLMLWGWAVNLPAEEVRPNIVYLLADDVTWRDFGFMGNHDVRTPFLDELASQSAVYVNGYVPMSVCRPSLATFLTGLYPHQHGICFNHPPPGLKQMRHLSAEQYHQQRATAEYLIRRQPTLPQLLKEYGYVSLQTGKHWEGDYENAGFTHGMTTGLPHDFDHYGTREQNDQKVAHGNGDYGLIIGRETMQPIDDFLSRYAGRKPLMIWYAPFLPHTPFDAPAENYEPYTDQSLPAELIPYYAEITRFDRTVGDLLALLEQHDVRQQTLIVLASDNGFRPAQVPDKNGSTPATSTSKLSAYEDGLRTPILLNWQKKIPAGRYEAVTQTVDLLPTVLEAVEMKTSASINLPGRSLWKAAIEAKEPSACPAFGAIYPNDATELERPERDVRARWIRDQDYKLIVPQPAEKKIIYSLYNLRNDPWETVNLIHEQELQPIVSNLKRKLNAWWQP